MKHRLKFKCWHCEMEYTTVRDIIGWPRLLVECPFCEHEGVVDLAPFRDETVPIFESTGGGSDSDIGFNTLNLPDVLITSPRDENDEA
jgi:hypothetical protein